MSLKKAFHTYETGNFTTNTAPGPYGKRKGEDIWAVSRLLSLHGQVEDALLDRGEEEVGIDIIRDLLILLYAHIHSCLTALVH